MYAIDKAILAGTDKRDIIIITHTRLHSKNACFINGYPYAMFLHAACRHGTDAIVRKAMMIKGISMDAFMPTLITAGRWKLATELMKWKPTASILVAMYGEYGIDGVSMWHPMTDTPGRWKGDSGMISILLLHIIGLGRHEDIPIIAKRYGKTTRINMSTRVLTAAPFIKDTLKRVTAADVSMIMDQFTIDDMGWIVGRVGDKELIRRYLAIQYNAEEVYRGLVHAGDVLLLVWFDEFCSVRDIGGDIRVSPDAGDMIIPEDILFYLFGRDLQDVDEKYATDTRTRGHAFRRICREYFCLAVYNGHVSLADSCRKADGDCGGDDVIANDEVMYEWLKAVDYENAYVTLGGIPMRHREAVLRVIRNIREDELFLISAIESIE